MGIIKTPGAPVREFFANIQHTACHTAVCRKMVLCHGLQKVFKNMFILDSEQANICFYYLKYVLQKPQKVTVAVWAARFAADVSNIVVMERKHTVTPGFTANRNRNIFKAPITMMCWTEIIPSTLISHQTQHRRDTLICYYHFLLKLFFNTILIKTKSPTNVFFSWKSEMKLFQLLDLLRVFLLNES